MEWLSKKLLDHLATAIGSLFTAILIAIGAFAPLDSVPQKLAMLLAGLFFLTTVTLLAYVIQLKLKSRLTPNYGIYWDRQLNPFCPYCLKLLSITNIKPKNGEKYTKLKCKGCDNQIPLHDGDKILTYQEAKELVNR